MSSPRLSAFFIDCPTDTFEEGVRFWSEAFGIDPRPTNDPAYVALPEAIPGITVEIQRVDAPGRYHVDFEADDVEAEVRRFEELGAIRVARVESWWILQAPTGHLLCVVPTE